MSATLQNAGGNVVPLRKEPVATAPTPAAGAPATTMKTWMAVVGATLGAFMAVLNIQIVNASLADIQGAIGAGSDEGGWVSTAYLIAEIIVIPMSGWLARVFSIRVYLLTSALAFLFFSASCALAQNLPEMIILRAFQGFSGGVLIPMAMTIIMSLLPKPKQPIGLALFSLSATFAPAIGPTIGGILTESWGWEYIFYVNLVPGAVMFTLLFLSLEKAPMNLGLLARGDWPGIVTMAIGLGCLQTVLEDGNKNDWFGSDYIARLSVVAGISLAVFLYIELTSSHPLLNLRLLLRRNFGFGIVANFLLGIALYGSVFVLPLYLTRIQGYNSEQVGLVLAWTGIPQIFLIPVVPRLMRVVNPRILIGVGFFLFSTSMFMNTAISPLYSGDQLFWPNIVRAIGQALAFTPLSAMATGSIERENAGSASALYNMLRNLGGAFGIALLQTFLNKREQFHSNILSNSISMFDEATRIRVSRLTSYFLSHGVSDQAAAQHKAVIAIGNAVRKQANIMAFGDAFFLLGAALLVALIATLMLKRPAQPPAGAGR